MESLCKSFCNPTKNYWPASKRHPSSTSPKNSKLSLRKSSFFSRRFRRIFEDARREPPALSSWKFGHPWPNPLRGQAFSEVYSFYGGELALGKRKSRRPLSSRKPLHLVLKANRFVNLFKDGAFVKSKLGRYAKLSGIRIYSLSIQRDHIHLCIRIHDRNLYKKFVRCLTGVLAKHFGKGLWKVLPFTRVGQWGRGFAVLKSYLQKNEDEIYGVVPYQKRKNHYRKYKLSPPILKPNSFS